MNVSMTLPQWRRREAIVNGIVVRFTACEHALLTGLLVRGTAPTTVGTGIEIVWPEPDLEPRWAQKALYLLIGRIRAKGVRITNRHAHGYILSQCIADSIVSHSKHATVWRSLTREARPHVPCPAQLIMRQGEVGEELARAA